MFLHDVNVYHMLGRFSLSPNKLLHLLRLGVELLMHLQSLATRMRTRLALNIFFAFALLLALIAGYSISQTLARSAVPGSTSVNQVFRQASQTYGVPADLLKAICYIEGRMSNNDGIASPDNGFGCMHLVKNYSIDTLDKAAKETGASVTQLKQNLPANILGG